LALSGFAVPVLVSASTTSLYVTSSRISPWSDAAAWTEILQQDVGSSLYVRGADRLNLVGLRGDAGVVDRAWSLVTAVQRGLEVRVRAHLPGRLALVARRPSNREDPWFGVARAM
jgi:hypothetical protein